MSRHLLGRRPCIDEDDLNLFAITDDVVWAADKIYKCHQEQCQAAPAVELVPHGVTVEGTLVGRQPKRAGPLESNVQQVRQGLRPAPGEPSCSLKGALVAPVA